MTLYSQLLENVLLPCHNLVRGRRYCRYRRFLEQSQWWPQAQLLEFQWRGLRALLDHVFQSAPYYRRKYAEAGIQRADIRSMDDFRRLPVLTREEVREHRQELRSTSYRGRLIPHATGGSSGIPTQFYITIESYDWRTAATQRAYDWSGCRLGERALYLWGAPIGDLPPAKALKKKTHEFVQNQLVFNTFSQSPILWNGIYQQALKFKPRLMVGYVNSLDEFARFLSENGLPMPGVKAVIAAAEPLHENVRQRIQQAVGAPVFNTYGSREFMSLAAECELHRGLHINCENILLETADPASAEPSEILVTDLHNYGMPFLRYAIGDAGLLEKSPCPCGRGLPCLKSVEGRVLDILRTADGRAVPGEWFPHLLKDITEVREYQVEQKGPDHIVISALLSAPLSQRSQDLLSAEIRKVFGEKTKVELQSVSHIPRLRSGKRRVVIGLPGNQNAIQPAGSNHGRSTPGAGRQPAER